MRTVVALPIANARPRTSRSGTIGFQTRFSQPTKATTQTAPAARDAAIAGPARPEVLARPSPAAPSPTAPAVPPGTGWRQPRACPEALGREPRRPQAGSPTDRGVDPEAPVPVSARGHRPANLWPGGNGRPG